MLVVDEKIVKFFLRLGLKEEHTTRTNIRQYARDRAVLIVEVVGFVCHENRNVCTRGVALRLERRRFTSEHVDIVERKFHMIVVPTVKRYYLYGKVLLALRRQHFFKRNFTQFDFFFHPAFV